MKVLIKRGFLELKVRVMNPLRMCSGIVVRGFGIEAARDEYVENSAGQLAAAAFVSGRALIIYLFAFRQSKIRNVTGLNII